MIRLHKTDEPSVIDERVLKEAVKEQALKERNKQMSKNEDIRFCDVLSLNLSFKNILKIHNLWQFTSLTKLQLDNNIIEKIEGLDLLINIVWLDLSFNNIEVIEGLNMLTKIQDLTLYNNRISKIENLDAQKELNVLSIGNNEIKDIKDIIYLRSFPKLKALNISSNPMCTEQHFQFYVLAYLPDLEFLDYKMIDALLKAEAYEMFKAKIDEQNALEKQERDLQEISLDKERELSYHKSAFVEYLNTDRLFTDFFDGDIDGNKLKQMPGAEELLTLLREKLIEKSLKIFTFGLEQYEKRKAEEDMFWECINEAKKENNELGKKAVNEYLKLKNKLLLELQNLKDAQLMESKMNEFSVNITDLWDTLMTFELQIIEQLEETIKDFEHNMQEIVNLFLESLQGHLAEVRELQVIHNERNLECASTCIERLAKNENDEDFTEEIKMLLIDKDVGLNAVTSSHDYHMMKIDNIEDNITTGIKAWLKNLIETIHQKESIERNRTRVIEINNAIENFQLEIDDLEILTEGEENAVLVSKSRINSLNSLFLKPEIQPGDSISD